MRKVSFGSFGSYYYYYPVTSGVTSPSNRTYYNISAIGNRKGSLICNPFDIEEYLFILSMCLLYAAKYFITVKVSILLSKLLYFFIYYHYDQKSDIWHDWCIYLWKITAYFPFSTAYIINIHIRNRRTKGRWEQPTI